MLRQSFLPLVSLILLSCACGARKEIVASGAAMPADTSTTAVLPPEVYGRPYQLKEVIRLDAQLQPIPRPKEADLPCDGGSPFFRGNVPTYVMFTPGFSHVNYVIPSVYDVKDQDPYAESIYWFRQKYHFWISDTTWIHPDDSLITTSIHTWNEGLRFYERWSTIRLLYADTARLVIRVNYNRRNVPVGHDRPHYEEMHYAYVPLQKILGDRTELFFPSYEAADDYMMPLDSLPFEEIGRRRYPPMLFRPDTLRVGAEGGSFPVKTTLAVNTNEDTMMYGVLSYEGSAEADTVSERSLRRGECWVRWRHLYDKSDPIVVQPNEDPRPRRALITMQGDTYIPFMYHCIGRTPPRATLVILQEGAQSAPATSTK